MPQLETPLNKKNIIIIDTISLILLGICNLFYAIFRANFAELCVKAAFFDFPIFIGEILLFLCLILLFLKWRINHPKFNAWYYLLFFYFGFVLLKAFWGYFKWGPLAFRHAALFYYPLFAVLGYVFYRSGFFSNRKKLFLVLLLIFIFKFIPFYSYCLLTCFILALILIKAYPYKIPRYILFSLLLIVTPYKLFFHTSRTFLVSNTVAGIYIIIALFFILRIKKSNKLILSVLLMLFMTAGVLKIADRNAVKSITTFRKLENFYSKYNKSLVEKRDGFKMREIKEVKLYHPEAERVMAPKAAKELQEVDSREARRKIKELQFKVKEIEKKIKKAQFEAKETPQLKIAAALPTAEKTQSSKVKEIEKKMSQLQIEIEKAELEVKGLQSQMKRMQSQLKKRREVQGQIQQKPSLRNLDVAYNNALFRIFIWRDMLRQLVGERPLLGFDFGKPLRSLSIETLNWAPDEWTRDGWITAHNSYLHIIYRAGIIGILFILTIFVILFTMIRRSLQFKSINGVLLCGILINWLVAANFLVILELPYNAIPFWSIFGMTFTYVNNLRMKKKR